MISGGVVSTNAMICAQEARLRQSSVAVQVRRKTRTTGQSAGSSSSTKVTVGLGSQLSEMVGLPKTGIAPTTHSLVRLGSHVIVGGIVSFTVMIWMQHATLVQSSITQWVRKIWRSQPTPRSGLSVHV